MQSFVTRLIKAGSRLRRLIRVVNGVHWRESSLPIKEQIAVIHLSRLSSLRETFVLQILRLLRTLDYRVIYYVDSLDALFYLARCSESVIADYDLVLSRVLPAATDRCLLVCDNDIDSLVRMKWKAVLNIEFDLSKSRNELPNSLHIPFPDRSVGWLTHEIEKNRSQRKTIRVLFSGAYRGYRDRGIKRFLGKMERHEVIEVFQRFPGTRVIESKDDLDAVLAADNDGPFCCFVNTDKFRIPQEDWFSVLGRTQVFLCPPGVVHPVCHNAVEAMAVGTVPLINYHEWFHPRLTPDLNCLAFSDEAELTARLEWLMSIDNEKLLSISRAARAYYDEYLNPEIFAGKLRDRISEDKSGEKVQLVMTTEIADFLPRLKPDSVAFG